MAQQFRQNLGIDREGIVLRASEYAERIRTATAPLGHTTWFSAVARYPDPDDIMRVVAQTIWRLAGRRNAEYDRLVEAARNLTDQEERMALYRQADTLLMREAIFWPHGYARLHYLIKPWVKRFPLSPLRQSFWKDVVIEPH